MFHTYADSSFLLSLYIRDGNTAKAFKILPSLQKPLSPLTPFHRLELKNGLSRKVFQDQMTLSEATAVWANIESDSQIFSGGCPIEWGLVMPLAEQLSLSYTPLCGARSLDIIHVAIALNLGVNRFISFDLKQREFAKLAGLNILPASL